MYNYIILYMVTLCFYNTQHIGDTFFFEPFIRNFCNNNKNHTFYIWLLYGYYLYNDISNLKKINTSDSNIYNKILISGEPPEEYTDNNDLKKMFIHNSNTPLFEFMYKNETYIAINLWFRVLGAVRNFQNDDNMEMNPLMINNKFYDIIQYINDNQSIQYINSMVTGINIIPKLPMIEVNNLFNNWLLTNTKKICFFYNYKPRSITYNIVYNDIIVYLSNTYTDYIIIVPRFEPQFTGISNIKCCDRDFNCIETPDCKNLVMIEQITRACNIIITLPCGASWLFLNTTILSQKNKKYILSSIHYETKLNKWVSCAYNIDEKIITNINDKNVLNTIFE